MQSDASNDALPPLAKNRAYLMFQVARLAWIVAVQVQGVAVAWQVCDATGKPLDIGFVGLAQFVPMFLLSLVAGKAADTFDRRKIMLACYALSGLASVVLLVANATHRSSLPLVYSTLAVLGAARAFGGPASSALAVTLVRKSELVSAIAWASSAWQLAMICGPVAGGLLVAGGRGTNLAYATTGIALLLAMVVLTFLKSPPRSNDAPKERGVGTVLAGAKYVYRTRIIFGAISLDLFAVLLGGAVALLPFFAKELDVGPWGFGILRAAPAVGASLTAAFIGRHPIKHHAGKIMFLCVFVFGVATIAFGLSHVFLLSLLALFVTGAADMISVVVRQTLVQTRTPDEMRGRVSAVNLVFIGASNELGEFESGLTAAWLTTRVATVVGGIGTCVVVLAWAALFPELRNADKLEEK